MGLGERYNIESQVNVQLICAKCKKNAQSGHVCNDNVITKNKDNDWRNVSKSSSLDISSNKFTSKRRD